ncbi:MAG TPA: aminotransferase class I/II-fold pyridoxal phosphate-dependent enzyme [Deltaproteobacteria bacterium]|nr:aminotransferase class I/II-fold pyridoxal phosphate-dependent enzyme [Deltaproteobacteria bacterium]
MSLDVRPWVQSDDLSTLLPNELANKLQGSQILAIAAHVARCRAEGRTIANLTIGDFDPSLYPIPSALEQRIVAQLQAGQTNYPPAVGVPELCEAVRSFYDRALGLDYPPGSVQVGSGARPPIYAAFQTVVEPGDVVVYPVPTWNVRYYVYLRQAEGVEIPTRPEDGFMPTAATILPHLGRARMVVLNSPLNPAGTVIDPVLLREICGAIVAENQRRRARGDKPVVLLYDQVYWQLIFPGHEHHTPVGLVPEMAAYTIHIDAISKCWAATGIRVGWAVAPPPLISKMKPLVGHMGAWAARAEQLATAELIQQPEVVEGFLDDFRGQLRARLEQLSRGLKAMAAEGLPVDCLEPQGAIYLSVRFDLQGRTVAGHTVTDGESLRTLLLEEAGVAVVPFTAFGYPDGSGWVRLSVGAISEAEIDGALQRISALLRAG